MALLFSSPSVRPVVLFIPRLARPGFRGRGFGGLGAYTPSDIQSLIVQSAQSQGVPVNLALGIASHESGFNPNAQHVNTNGTVDVGVMQLNSTTVATLGVANPLDPVQNIDAGVGLLATLLQKYGGNQALALWAYANGSGAVVPGGTPPAATSQFIDYVTGYGGDAAPPAPSGDVTIADAASPLDASGSLDVLGFQLDPATVAVGAASLAALGALLALS